MNIEQQIMKLISADTKLTVYLIRNEFKPRQQADVRTALGKLINTGIVSINKNGFLEINNPVKQ